MKKLLILALVAFVVYGLAAWFWSSVEDVPEQ